MEGWAMPSAVRLREDYSAEELRALARRSKDVNQSRRLLSLAAVRDGMDRGSAAQDRRHGPPDAARLGPSLQRLGSGGPHRQLDGGSQASPVGGATGRVRARSSRPGRIARRTASCAGGGSTSSASSPSGSASTSTSAMSESCSKKLGFSHMSARPRHPAQDERIVEAFKKTSRAR